MCGKNRFDTQRSRKTKRKQAKTPRKITIKVKETKPTVGCPKKETQGTKKLKSKAGNDYRIAAKDSYNHKGFPKRLGQLGFKVYFLYFGCLMDVFDLFSGFIGKILDFKITQDVKLWFGRERDDGDSMVRLVPCIYSCLGDGVMQLLDLGMRHNLSNGGIGKQSCTKVDDST